MQELKELAALAYRDTTAENREYWKNEMGQALREIHQVYDDKLDGMRNELETYYNLKVCTSTADIWRGEMLSCDNSACSDGSCIMSTITGCLCCG